MTSLQASVESRLPFFEMLSFLLHNTICRPSVIGTTQSIEKARIDTRASGEGEDEDSKR